MNNTRVKNSLTQCPIFSAVDNATLEQLTATSLTRSIPTGDVIFDIGQPSEELYVLLKGIVSFQYYAFDGKKVTLGIAEEFMVVGDMELFDPTPRKSRAVVIHDCDVAVLPKTEFLKACRTHPSIYEKLLQIYSRRLQQAARTMLIKDASQLLCSVLINLSQKFGKDTELGLEIQLNLSQEELASYVGIPRQRLNRILGEFKSKNWLSTKYNKITLHDVSSMRQFLARHA